MHSSSGGPVGGVPTPAFRTAVPALLQANTRLVVFTAGNYVTYSCWTLLNKFQFTPTLDGVHHPAVLHEGLLAHGGLGVRAALFVTGVQMVLAGLTAAVAIFVFGIQNRRASSTAPPLWTRRMLLRRVLPLGAARCFDIGFGNLALVAVSVAVQQVVKSLLPIFVSALSYAVLGMEVSQRVWFSLVPVVGGTVLATVGGPAHPSVFGLFAATVSCFARSFKCVLNAKLLEPPSPSSPGTTSAASTSPNEDAPLLPLEILLLEAPTSGVMLLLASFMMEGTLITDNMPALVHAAPLNLLGGVLMFFNQASYISVIQCSSAVSCQVLMNLKMLLLIVVSVHLFQTPFYWMNYAGVAVATGGCMAYAYASASAPARRRAPPKRVSDTV